MNFDELILNCPEINDIVDVNTLGSIQKQKIQYIHNSINLSDLKSVLDFGTGIQKSSSDFADKMLEKIKIADTEKASKIIEDLNDQFKDLDAEKLAAGNYSFFEKIFGSQDNDYKKFIEKCQSLEEKLEQAKNKLVETRKNFIGTLAMFQELSEENMKNLEELNYFLAAGFIKRSSIDENDDTDRNNKDTFIKRIEDLRITRTIILQNIKQIELVQQNINAIIQKIQSYLLNTIPLWKNQLGISISLFGKRKALESEDKNDMSLRIKIGFLGEFSSGKSTIINALMGKRILPAMEIPTTKSIIEVIPDEVQDIECYSVQETSLKPISQAEFMDTALGRLGGEVVLKIPESYFLNTKYVIVDTPGIQSIDKTDMDITYGYLPFLDGAVICLDINKGSLTNSLIQFLNKTEIRPIADNFIFALTYIDTVDLVTLDTIRENIIKQLEDMSNTYGTNLTNIRDKVVAVSAFKVLEGDPSYTLDEFKNAFDKIFIERANKLRDEKIQKESLKIQNEIYSLLEYKKQALKLNDEEIVKRETQLNDEMRNFAGIRSDIDSSLTRFRVYLSEKLGSYTTNFITGTVNKGNVPQNEINRLLLNGITLIIEKEISAYLKELNSRSFTSLNSIDAVQVSSYTLNQEIHARLQQLLSSNEFQKIAATDVLAGLILPVGQLMNNILFSTMDALNRMNPRMNIQMSKLNNMLRGFDPVRYFEGYYTSKNAVAIREDDLLRFADEIAYRAYEILRNEIERIIYNPIEEKISLIKKTLQQTYEERNQLNQKFEDALNNIQ